MSTYETHEAPEVTAKYPLTRVQITAHDIPGGGRDFHKDELIGRQLPKRTVLGLVDNEPFADRKEKNPLHFQHFKVTSLGLARLGLSEVINCARFNRRNSYPWTKRGTQKCAKSQCLVLIDNGYFCYHRYSFRNINIGYVSTIVTNSEIFHRGVNNYNPLCKLHMCKIYLNFTFAQPLDLMSIYPWCKFLHSYAIALAWHKYTCVHMLHTCVFLHGYANRCIRICLCVA